MLWAPFEEATVFEVLLSMPAGLAASVSVAFAVATGLLAYFGSAKLVSRYQASELRDGAGNLFRVTGILVSLMLALAFADVISDWKSIGRAVDHEAAAISDVFYALRAYDDEATRELRAVLIDYTQTLVDEDWPAMARNELSTRGDALLERLVDGALELPSASRRQEDLRSFILRDLDAMSDSRLVRLNHARAQLPLYLPIIIFGFLVTMACLGSNRPQLPLIVLGSLYASLVGLVLYLVVSLSDPFSGWNTVEPATLDRLLAWMRSVEG